MKKHDIAVFFVCTLLLLAACGSKSDPAVLQPPSTQSSKPTQQSGSSSQTDSEPQQAEIKLYLNGNRLVLAQTPLLEGETVMVPVAEICGAFSREITAVPQEHTLTLTDISKDKIIVLTDKDGKAVVNGSAVNLAAPPALTENGTMLVALSDFRTLFDADNKYQSDILAAYITESGLC